jgi:pimeloyl-ACP methyl ester carboxylesterase
MVWLLAAVPFARTAVAQDKEPTQAEIDAALNSPNSYIRNGVWKRLNAENPRHFKIILEILKKLSWHDRDGAIEALSTAGTEETLKKLLQELKKSREPFVRQGLAKALARMNDDRVYAALFEALNDKVAAVRREVVHALRIHKRNDTVEALVQRFQKEEDPVVRSFLESSLNDLTQAFQGPYPLAWQQWWQAAKGNKEYKLGEVDEETKRQAEELGRKLRNRTFVSAAGGVTLESAERGGGSGVPILVIPEYGYSKNIILPFLSELERRHKLHYIDLPPVSSFKNIKTRSAKKIPDYPIDELVEAFEDLRKEIGKEHFAIMACGMNSWIAMRYAEKFPQSVAAMILVAPISSRKAYGDATQRFQTMGKKGNDVEMHYYGLTRQGNIDTGESVLEQEHKKDKDPLPRLDGEPGCIDRREWSLFFKEERDSVISMLYPVKDHHLGNVWIPDFNCLKGEKPSFRNPMLVIAGTASLYTTVQDCQAIAKHYGGLCLVYENTSCMPFAEESTRFNKDVAAFLQRFTRAKKPSDSKKDAKEPGQKAGSRKDDGQKPETSPGKKS